MPDALTPFLIVAGVLLGIVAFLNVVLSPLIAAFAAGAGFGGLGVLAVLRAGRPRA
jgi:hypothetical protein